MASPFEILSVDRDADAAEVKRAYRERVKEAHPDHGGSVREFKRVRAAYEELKDGPQLDDADGEETGDQRHQTGDQHHQTGGVARTSPDESDSGAAAGSAAGTPADGEPTRQERARVEYLNYEVLDDYGWSLDDDGLFEAAARAGLNAEDFGEFWIRPRESLLEAAERRGLEWPFACRGGACANCAVMVLEGEMTTRIDNVLPQEMVDRGFQLSCNGVPLTDELKVVHNVKHVPALEELLLPPRPFEQAYLD